MMIQDRAAPKRPQSPHRKPLDLSSWISDNVYKIVLLVLLVATVAAALLLPSIGDTAALLCFERARAPVADPSRLPPPPAVAWNSIRSIPPLPSDPHASFRSDRWIIVSLAAGSSPSDALLRLSRIRGWQLLLVGTSHTPPDFSLKGAIFLSLEHQARLGFRISGLLPYHNFVRKSIGYLFAIQHGANRIYDVDDRAEVLSDDPSSRFDAGELSGSEVLLQYRHDDPNRTVVNPYVHFGQRSVWPRGLPLDRAGDVAREEFYTEVFGGRQFVQQGISDGLPDVDAVFYLTRKSSAAGAFDIRFDGDAPKVALPQGVMAPVNSFNTLFHAPAFWGLMLPVSISSMASDVIRGYWAQRILWEIGGFVAVYPPTVHRADRAETYPFAEEKDLHVNVGRLVKFLVSWRSKKQTLFERILHLSYAMAEEGFWTELDVRFTAAWLQDLLAVGYQQPRLMSLELDRPRAAIGHGDRREFVPKKLPSVHLGAEETSLVNSEIGNLIRWRKNFGNVVLIMFCSGSPDRTALEWRLLYGRIFKTVIILSEQSNSDLAVEKGELWQAYKYLPKLFDRYKGAEGFLFLQDDMILNYWNLLEADKNKLWITNTVPSSWSSVSIDGNSTDWIPTQAALVKKAVGDFPVHFQVSFKESNPDDKMILCGSEVFYIPRRFVSDFADLVELVGGMGIHHIVAVPMFFTAMDSPRNFDSGSLSSTVYRKEPPPPTNDTLAYYTSHATAVYPVTIRDEAGFIKLIRAMAAGDPLLMELV